MSGSRVSSIPNNVWKMIQNIKEIAGNHSDDEIHAMLKECSMDPNETAQKLLLQDPFHEVKRKRDKKKESNREPADTRWRPGSQGRGGRGGRGNYSSRYVSQDAVGGKSIAKENGIHQGTDGGIPLASSPPSQDTENKLTIPTSSSVSSLSNGPAKVENPITAEGCTSCGSSVIGNASVEERSVTSINKMGTPAMGEVKSSSPPVSGVYSSASDPVLVASLDSRITGSVGTIRRGVGSQRSTVETTVNKVVSRDVTGSDLSSLTGKGSLEMNHSHTHGKVQGNSQGFEGNQLPDALSRTSSAGSRPSSNYSSRSQQPSGPQKAAGPSKEWKPKSTNVNAAQAFAALVSDVKPITGEAACSVPALSSTVSEDSTSKLQKKLEELQFSETQHVIIPNHLQVPESERTGLSFGSFDANFGLTTRFVNDPESDKSSTPQSESSQEIEESVEDPASGAKIASPTAHEADYQDHSQSPPQIPENLSSREPGTSSSIPTEPEYDQSTPEATVAPEGPQYSVVHTAPTYSNFGLVPQMIGNQFPTFEGAEPQERDASRLPSFIVPQPFDPATSYYASMYRPTADGDGRFSPFLTPGAAAKYNGNISVLPAQIGQSTQEAGNSLLLSSTGQSPLVTQAAGAMQSSAAVSQQSVPVFRQPAGVHLSHYPPNYMPYSQYYPPFYLPSPAIHHFLSNATFPQQAPTGSVYPPPLGAAAGATPVKYSMSQYKPGTNTGNPTHIGVPTGYGAYPTAVTSVNSTGNEDLTSSQYKENNVYITGQQSEGSAVWIPTPGRDISALQATSFYNLPQGQHMTFAPTQASHGAFPGIYHHPTQTVAAATVHPMLQQSQAMPGAVEMVGPPAGVYQQPQRPQMNWVNNY